LNYLFEGCVFDTDRRELRRGSDAIAVEPQVFDLLEYLIRNRERVVTKDDLIKAVWNGRIISESALGTRINQARAAIGDNGDEQRLIRTLRRKGVRFVGAVCEVASDSCGGTLAAEPSMGAAVPVVPASAPPQEVRFCRTADGVNLAMMTSGDGLPLVRTGTWLSHVEQDRDVSLWTPLFTTLAKRFRLVRYDPRGCGLSDWDVAEISFEACVRDLGTVVDALGLQRFALLGVSQGAAVSIAYAARHPERVSRLVLSGGRPVGWRRRGDAAEMAVDDAFTTLIRHGWGQDNPAFRQVFAARNWPDATAEELRSLTDLQRLTTSPENAIRIRRAHGEADVRPLLAQVRAPTLVLHSRNDAANPLELGLMLAREIPNARLVTVESRNHIPLPREPAWPVYLDALCTFLEEAERNRPRLVATNARSDPRPSRS
jgi:pimeloyl-ACP methyl ester carboxylesterase/DNA-binding winged helix-turn-helix (wHTH) protein